MKVNLSILSLLAMTAACGSSGMSTPDFTANAPTFDKVAISQNDSQTAPPVMAQNSGSTQALTAAAPTVDCHPHLFERTGEIIGNVNRHFFKLVGHVEDLIKDSPKLSSGQTKTWESIKNGIDRKLTITATANADGSVTYVFELDIGLVPATGSATLTKVMSGSLTHSGPQASELTDAGASERVEDKGTVTFDYSALASVITSEMSTGQITDTFDNVRDPVHGVKRSATMTLVNFHFDNDQHGPRNGSYSWEREPSVGGKFQFTDSLVLLCPANPSNLAADLTAVARWYKAADGSVHGRSDARATGGQIPSGDSWIGMTCAQGQTTSAPAEGEWMMKEEDASGASLSFQLVQVGVNPCDPAFGPVPDSNDKANDYDFSKTPSFPNEW